MGLRFAILAKLLRYVNTLKHSCMKINKISYNTNAYPEILKHIGGPPKQLFVLREIHHLLEQPRLAVVGSRRVTPYGRNVTKQLAGEAAKQGLVIVSGLALGVDAIAHQAALDVGGKTIAVLPSAVDEIYPRSHVQLAREILKNGGALISEYPAGTEPYPANFVARNRIVSGISDGVLITEAAEKSGTLHTANFALEQGKTVMAVPGNINSELSKGTNSLIKAGATPVTSSKDIFEALKIDVEEGVREVMAANEQEAVIIELLKRGVTDASELQLRSELSATLFNQTLTMLEITGKAKPLGAGHWGIA